MTLSNVHHLIKHSRNVKTQTVLVLHFFLALHFFETQPALVRKGELQLVAVKALGGRAHDGLYLGQFHLAYALEIVDHFPLLKLKLFGIGQTLPFATAANPKMRAKRFNPQIGIVVEFHRKTLVVGPALLFTCTSTMSPGTAWVTK